MNNDDILKLSNIFYKCSILKDKKYRILYNISRSGGFPAPSDRISKDKDDKYPGLPGAWERYWLNNRPDSAIFLTTNPIAVIYNHGLEGKVRTFKVSENLIARAKGIHRFDDANEIIIPKQLWEEGFATKDIIFVGSVSDKRISDDVQRFMQNAQRVQPIKDKEIDLMIERENKMIRDKK